MNFFRRLINKIRTKNKIENKIENQIKNSKEKTDFTSEIYCNIAEMKLGLENIKSETEYTELKSLIESLEKYIEKSSNILEERTIEDKVNRIVNESNIIVEIKLNPEVPQLTMDKVNQELATEDYYKKVKEIYKLKYQKATQKILMKKAERINNSFDLIGDKISLEELKSYLEILVQKKEEFTGTMQNKYIEILAEIEYKISMLEGSLETAMEISKKVENSRVKEIIWSKLFIADVEKFISESDEDISKDLKEMLEKRKLQGETAKIFTQQNIESYFLAKKNEEKYIENKKIAENLDMASRRLEIMKSTNEISSTLFQDAISDQKKLAKELGLADKKNFLETDDIKVYKRREEELPLICDYLKSQGEYYEIYREIDEFHNVYIVTSKEAEIDYEDRDIVLCNADEQIDKELVPITKEFAQLYSKINSSWFYRWDEGTIIRKGTEYYLTKKTYNSRFELRVGGMLHEYEDNNYRKRFDHKDDPDYDPTSTISGSRVGKFNIEIPYKRSIIPILEKLKEEEIEFTIPPIKFNEEIQLKNPVIKIYMDFKDLEKYKDKVHNEISTPEKGIIKICGNNQDTEYHYMMKLIMKGIKYKHKEKIMRSICMQNYPDKPYSKKEIAENLDMASRILETEKSTSENSSTTFKTQLKESTNKISNTSFQDAISDQKKLAKELGLADEKNFLETDDIKVYKRREEELPLICDYLKGQGEHYEIYREIDEFHNVYIVTSKEAEIDYEDRDIVLCNADEQIGKELVPITKEFAQLYSKMNSIWFDAWDEGTIIRKGTEYYLTKKTYNSRFELRVRCMLIDYESANYPAYKNDPDYDPTSTISDSRVGKFNIEIPYKRSIIPILEKLKKEEIEFTIPPINFNEEIQLKNPAIKIYMDFEDLEKYKDKVHNEISTPEKGIIKICGNNQDTEYHYIMQLIMNGIKYKNKEKIINYPDKPYSKDEEEEER